MSEKIYLRLWRLYPRHFREAYRDAALQLFRDRTLHEKGLLLQLRLWLDLLTDFGSSLPGVYLDVEPALTCITVGQSSDGTPSFCVLGGQPPRFGALFYGGVLSLVLFGSISAAIGHGGSRRALGSWVLHQRPTDVYYCAREIDRGLSCARAIRLQEK